MDRNGLLLLFTSLFLFCNFAVADPDFLPDKNVYSPYLEMGGVSFLNVNNSNFGGGADFFVPIWQQPTNLIFTDIRFYDRSNKLIEGNFHLGYRHLNHEQQKLYGLYGAFDRKRTSLNNYFNQLTLGGEYWWNKLFFGGNFYFPIGKTARLTGATESANLREKSLNLYNIWITNDERYEKAMGGADLTAGFEFARGLTGYLGGYYFKTKDIDAIYGPRAKLAYDWFLENGQKIGKIFDKFGLEAGVQNDRPRGTTWYLGANFRIGLLASNDTNLQGISRHMIDLVRRDVDVVVTEAKTSNGGPLIQGGKEVVIEVQSNEPSENSPTLLHGSKANISDHPNIKIIPGSELHVMSQKGYLHRLVIPKYKPITQKAPIIKQKVTKPEPIENKTDSGLFLSKTETGKSEAPKFKYEYKNSNVLSLGSPADYMEPKTIINEEEDEVVSLDQLQKQEPAEQTPIQKPGSEKIEVVTQPTQPPEPQKENQPPSGVTMVAQPEFDADTNNPGVIYPEPEINGISQPSDTEGFLIKTQRIIYRVHQNSLKDAIDAVGSRGFGGFSDLYYIVPMTIIFAGMTAVNYGSNIITPYVSQLGSYLPFFSDSQIGKWVLNNGGSLIKYASDILIGSDTK